VGGGGGGLEGSPVCNPRPPPTPPLRHAQPVVVTERTYSPEVINVIQETGRFRIMRPWAGQPLTGVTVTRCVSLGQCPIGVSVHGVVWSSALLLAPLCVRSVVCPVAGCVRAEAGFGWASPYPWLTVARPSPTSTLARRAPDSLCGSRPPLSPRGACSSRPARSVKASPPCRAGAGKAVSARSVVRGVCAAPPPSSCPAAGYGYGRTDGLNMTVDSVGFDVTQGPPDWLRVVTPVGDAWAGGQPFGIQPSVAVVDKGGNIVNSPDWDDGFQNMTALLINAVSGATLFGRDAVPIVEVRCAAWVACVSCDQGGAPRPLPLQRLVSLHVFERLPRSVVLPRRRPLLCCCLRACRSREWPTSWTWASLTEATWRCSLRAATAASPSPPLPTCSSAPSSRCEQCPCSAPPESCCPLHRCGCATVSPSCLLCVPVHCTVVSGDCLGCVPARLLRGVCRHGGRLGRGWRTL
jgi:hypothetical protein